MADSEAGPPTASRYCRVFWPDMTIRRDQCLSLLWPSMGLYLDGPPLWVLWPGCHHAGKEKQAGGGCRTGRGGGELGATSAWIGRVGGAGGAAGGRITDRGKVAWVAASTAAASREFYSNWSRISTTTNLTTWRPVLSECFLLIEYIYIHTFKKRIKLQLWFRFFFQKGRGRMVRQSKRLYALFVHQEIWNFGWK